MWKWKEDLTPLKWTTYDDQREYPDERVRRDLIKRRTSAHRAILERIEIRRLKWFDHWKWNRRGFPISYINGYQGEGNEEGYGDFGIEEYDRFWKTLENRLMAEDAVDRHQWRSGTIYSTWLNSDIYILRDPNLTLNFSWDSHQILFVW